MSDRWDRVTAIVDRALAEPPARRDAFVNAACAGDAGLAAEVRSLVAHAEAAGDFLEPGSTRLSLGADGTSPESLPGEGSVLGAWSLLRPVGEGGMGTVWLAERIEGEFRQRGALKLIRAGLAYEEAIRRFRRERQILASLDHPQIARLLDGGTTTTGLPYLVMEYVEGEPLYEHCSGRRLSLNARLRMFVSLCSAVHYAHQKLVVHRDLKPGNVLVTADSSPKLLDFGVAKIFESEPADSAEGLHTVALPFTPLYASPEHLRGEEVTTAADIYSLGVLLFELLTGVHPYRTRSGSAADVIRTVMETEPRRPSTSVTAPRVAGPADTGALLPAPPLADASALRRRLTGDLDTIVLKAIQKDPARRYASAERLAADIERFLDFRPIEARPDSWSYRTSKFVRRNRAAVAAGALAVLAVIAGLAVSVRQGVIANHERGLAERRLRDVQSLANTLMFDVYDGIENMPGATAVRRRVIEQATGYLDGLAAQSGRDSALQASLADAYQRLGTAQRVDDLGPAGGNAASAHSFARATELREALLRRYPDDERALAGLVQSYTRSGELDEVMGKLTDALDLMRRAERAGERLHRLHPATLAYEQGLPRRHNNVGLALLYNRRVDEAMIELRRAIAAYAVIAARDTADWQERRLLAMSLTVYGDCMQQRPALADSAEIVERRALDLYTGLWRKRPENLDLEMRVADGYERLAQYSAYRDQRPDSALAQVAIAQRLIEAVAASDTANHDYAIDVAGGRATRGLLLALCGRDGEAERTLRGVAPKLSAWARADTGDARLRAAMGDLDLGLGLALVHRASGKVGRDAAGRWREARESLLRARRALGPADSAGGADSRARGVEGWIARGLAQADTALAGSLARR